MVRKKIIVDDPLGIHLRTAGAMCEEAVKFESLVTFEYKNDKTANAKSVLSVLAAGIKYGEEINLISDGIDEEEALEAVSKIFLETLKD